MRKGARSGTQPTARVCLLFLATLAGLAPGCLAVGGTECTVGPRHCEGNAIVQCEPPCSEIGCTATWKTEPCPGACVETKKNGPRCALSAAKDPACAGTDAHCNGSGVVQCDDGFAVSRADCLSPSACIQTETGRAICAIGNAPDARCPGGDLGTPVCDGKTALLCLDGFALQVRECPQACAMLSGGAGCALDSTPDPRCAADTFNFLSTYCDGDVLVSCDKGFSISRTPCDCVVREGIAICRG